MKSFTTLLAASNFLALTLAAQTANQGTTNNLDDVGGTTSSNMAAQPTNLSDQDAAGTTLNTDLGAQPTNLGDQDAAGATSNTDLGAQPTGLNNDRHAIGSGWEIAPQGCAAMDGACRKWRADPKITMDGIEFVPRTKCQGQEHGEHGGSGAQPTRLRDGGVLPPDPYNPDGGASGATTNVDEAPGGDPAHTMYTTSSAAGAVPSDANDPPAYGNPVITTTNQDTQATSLVDEGGAETDQAGTAIDPVPTDGAAGTGATASTFSTVTTSTSSIGGAGAQATDNADSGSSSSASSTEMKVSVKFAPRDDDGPSIDVPADDKLFTIPEDKVVASRMISVSAVGADSGDENQDTEADTEAESEADTETVTGSLEGVTCVAFKDKAGEQMVGDEHGVKVGETGSLGESGDLKVKALRCGKGGAEADDLE